jgi:hypothetical protein
MTEGIEETETPHPDYVKGFNEGYILSKHMPDLSAKLAPALEGSNRTMGMKDGREEALLELRREKYPAWRRTDWLDKQTEGNAPEKQKDLDKEIDAPEPEND